MAFAGYTISDCNFHSQYLFNSSTIKPGICTSVFSFQFHQNTQLNVVLKHRSKIGI